MMAEHVIDDKLTVFLYRTFLSAWNKVNHLLEAIHKYGDWIYPIEI